MSTLIVALAAVLALVHSACAEKLPVTAFTTADGLAHNHVNRIKFDSRGFLWFCTDAGLSRFDGRRFFTLTTEDGLPHPHVNDLVEGRDGAFWLATDGGVSRFTLSAPGTNEKPTIETFRSMEHPGEHYDAIEFDRDGRLWAGGHAGLYQIEFGPAKVTLVWKGWVVPNAAIPRLVADRRGGLWITTTGGAVFRDPAGKLTPVQPSPHSKNPYAQSVLQDREGGIWVGYRAGGFCRLANMPRQDGITPLFCLTEQDGWRIKDVRSIFESSDGRLWLGTTTGFCEFERMARKLSCFEKDNGLAETWVPQVAEDPDGNLWLGTLGSGVMRVARPGFVQFSAERGSSASSGVMLHSVDTGADRLAWAGRKNDTIHILQSEGRRLREIWKAKLPVAPDQYGAARAQGTLQDSHGVWWIPSGPHLHRYAGPAGLATPRAVPMETFELPDGYWFSRLIEDSSGALWASVVVPGNEAKRQSRWLVVRGPEGGAFRTVQSVEGSLTRVEASIGMGAYISSFRDDRSGGLWMGISSNRQVHPPGTVTLLRLQNGKVQEFSMNHGLPSGNVHFIHLDRSGRLWFATGTGLVGLDNPTAEHPRFVRYQLADGAAPTEVFCVTEDQQGRIFAGTAKGVDRLDPRTGRVRHFSVADGLPPGSVFAAINHRGRLWFMSESILSLYEPESVPARPPATFTVYPTTSTELPHDRSFIEAGFTSPTFSVESARFQYRLVGVDADWGPPVSDNVVRYAGMSPGSYELQARAIGAEGLASERAASLMFSVTPPFWRTWWFLGLALALVSALIYRIHLYRLQRLLEVERLRVRIASDLHDDIGASLSQVSMLGELAKRSLNGDANPGLADTIERMAGASREAVSAMGDIVWSIHPTHDRFDGVVQRMRRFANDVLSARDIDFHLTAPAVDVESAVGLEARHDLLMIFKESVSNAARHSGCGSIQVSLRMDNHEIRLVVEDDGRGFDPQAITPGHGMTTMRARAEKLGGRCELNSSAVGGTRVVVSMPVGARSR